MVSPPPSPRQRRRTAIFAKAMVAALLFFTFLFFFYPALSPFHEDGSGIESISYSRAKVGGGTNDGDVGTNHAGDAMPSDETNAPATKLVALANLGGAGEWNGTEKCTLSHGNWIHDTKGPIYTSGTCQWIANVRKGCKINKNDMKNYWVWQPKQCDLEEFQPMSFLELMKGKTIAFVGDENVEYQARSLLCLLSKEAALGAHEETDMNGHVLRWRLGLKNDRNTTTVVMVRSEYLIQQELNSGGGRRKRRLRVDKLEEGWAEVASGRPEVVVVGAGAAAAAAIMKEDAVEYVVGREERALCRECADLGKNASNPVPIFRTIMRSVVLSIGGIPGFSGTTFFLPPPPQLLSSRFSLAIRRELRLHHRRRTAYFHNSSRMFLLPLLPPFPSSSSSCLSLPVLDASNRLLFHYIRTVGSTPPDNGYSD